MQKKILSLNVVWDSYNIISCREIGLLQDSSTELNNLPTQKLLGGCINKLSSILYQTGTTCTSERRRNHETSVESIEPPLQRALEQSDETLSRFISDATGAEDWHAAKSVVLKENRKIHIGKITGKWTKALDRNDAKEIWSAINWKGETDENSNLQTERPSSEDLAPHFLTKGDAHEPIHVSSLPKNRYVEELDKPISLDEVNESSRLLKEKSTSDGWCPQMVSGIQSSLFPVILVLFDVILSFAFFPTKWCTTVVAAIFKNKGSTQFAKYYRPVTLVHMLYKWFDFILLKRFKSWFVPAEEQTAYQQGKSCAGHIFLLRCLINFAKSKRKKFFICTIDYDGAFDRVSRNILLKKLALFGAGSIFISCIAAMYLRTESAIIQKDNYCTYELLSGIKQRLPLSPYLFLFYINDIFDFFNAIYTNSNNDLLDRLHVLIHAYDATILTSSYQRMSQKVRSMLNFCNLNKIQLQLSKCKLMVIVQMMTKRKLY